MSKPRKPIPRRVGLKRSPIKRGTSQLKRSKLNPVSKQKRKQDRANSTLHALYRDEFPACQCGCGREATSIHEIFGGGSRLLARQRRSCILHLAEIPCHPVVQYLEKTEQLALKLEHDPWGFDLVESLGVWGRAPTAILIAEVVAHLPKNLPTADDCRLTYEHWARKVTMLQRQLEEAKQQFTSAEKELSKAEARELAIKRSQR